MISGLVVTNLYPSPSEPNRGVFNKRQFDVLEQRHQLQYLIPTQHKFSCQDSNKTYYAMRGLPLVGRFLNPLLIARQITRYVLSLETRPKLNYLLGSYGFPEGVAVAIAARKLQIPAIIKFHGSDLNMMLHMWPQGRQIRSAMSAAAGVVAVSERLSGIVRTITDSPSTTIYNGVSWFENTTNVSLASRSQGPKPIIYIGNLKRSKGILDLIEAYAVARSNVTNSLTIVGDGPDAQDAKKLVIERRLSDSVTFMGALDHQAALSQLTQAALLVLPSYSEGVPNVVLEAMAAGIPYVATNVGGVPEIHEPAIGSLCEPGNIADLARLMESHAGREVPMEAVLRIRERFKWQSSGGQLADFIETCLTNNKDKLSQ